MVDNPEKIWKVLSTANPCHRQCFLFRRYNWKILFKYAQIRVWFISRKFTKRGV